MRHLNIVAALSLLLSITGFTPVTYGVFQNDTSRNVPLLLFSVNAVSENHDTWKSLTVRARSALRVPIFEGTAIITEDTGAPISKCSLIPRERVHDYYDAANRSYYYRITRTSIRPVHPREALAWHR